MKIYIRTFRLACLVVLGVLFAALVTHGQKNESDKFTIVQKGQATAKEREYSKVYKKIYAERGGQKLSEVARVSNPRHLAVEIPVVIRAVSTPTISADLDPCRNPVK